MTLFDDEMELLVKGKALILEMTFDFDFAAKAIESKIESRHVVYPG